MPPIFPTIRKQREEPAKTSPSQKFGLWSGPQMQISGSARAFSACSAILLIFAHSLFAIHHSPVSAPKGFRSAPRQSVLSSPDQPVAWFTIAPFKGSSLVPEQISVKRTTVRAAFARTAIHAQEGRIVERKPPLPARPGSSRPWSPATQTRMPVPLRQPLRRDYLHSTPVGLPPPPASKQEQLFFISRLS